MRRREQVQAAEVGGMDAHHEPKMDHPRVRHRGSNLHHHRDRGPNHVWIGPTPAPDSAPSPVPRLSPALTAMRSVLLQCSSWKQE